MKRIGSSLAILTLVASGIANAADSLWSIQFTDTSGNGSAQVGAAMTGSPGDTWNMCEGASGTDFLLYDSTGSDHDVRASWNGNGAYVADNNPCWAWGGFGFYGTGYANLMQGYLYITDDASHDVTVSGLAALSEYIIHVYTQGNFSSSGRQISVTTTTDTLGGTTILTSDATDAYANSFYQDQNYLLLSGYTDASGLLTISFSQYTGESDINGIQIYGTVPEPSDFALLGGLGALGFVLVRRRSRR